MTETTPPNKGLPPGQDSPREGELLKRRHRRRNDLSTLAGISREEIRIYYLLMAGKLSLAAYEIASRGLGRHAATVRLEQEAAQIADLQQRLAEIQQGRTLAALPAPARTSDPPSLPAWAQEPAKAGTPEEPQP